MSPRSRLPLGSALVLAVVASLGFVWPSQAFAEDEPPERFHLGFDLAWQRARVRFVSPAAIALDCECGVQPFVADVVRGTASVGWAGIAIEGGFSRAANAPMDDFLSWSVGVRLDTSYAAAFSMAFRFAYVRRVGGLPGTGGRASLSLQMRIVRSVVLYAEAGGEVVDVPSDPETVVSYAFFYGGGLRFVFSR